MIKHMASKSCTKITIRKWHLGSISLDQPWNRIIGDIKN